MSDELKPSAENFIPIALYDALARERERLAREVVALRARVAELEAELAAVPRTSIAALREIASFDIEDSADYGHWHTVDAWLTAHAPKEAE